MHYQISLRIFALEYNLEQLLKADKETQRDALKDVGLDYDVKYLDNEWFKEKDKEYRELADYRERVKFTCLLNFTQCFFTLKDYLKNLNPDHTNKIEKFFSRSKKGSIPRKDISNDLKHNPEKDIEFGFKKVGEEVRYEKNMKVYSVQMKHSWFYGDFESVDYCSKLFEELIAFVKTLNK